MNDNLETSHLPRKITAAYLDRAALHYLERYASSAENLRRVLHRKVEKRCRLRGEDPADFALLVEAAMARVVEAGLVDDSRYAQGKVASLRRRGGSARLIGAKLAGKGVGREVIAAALQGDEGDEGAAASAYARRRRLGPFRGERDPARDKDLRRKDLAALARAGFGFDVARRVLDGEGD